MGDPTAFGNLPPCNVAIQAIVEAVQAPGHSTSYVDARGLVSARKAISNFHTGNPDNYDNVIIANGCSGALEIAITAILDTENNNESILLVPDPGFPLYQVIAESHGVTVHHYRLLPHNNWEIDLSYLRDLILKHSDKRVVMVVNNPSNPTGVVFSKLHLQHIIELCEEFHIPIIADEVYGDIVFGDTKFYPMAQIVSENCFQLPIITASGLAKQFLLPGWRIGWIVFHDK